MPAHAREWTPDDINTVRSLLTDQHQCQKQIAERFGCSVRAVAGVVTRMSFKGLNHHGTPAKSKPIEAKPTRPNVVVKFPKGPNVTPGRYIRELPIEDSPKAVTFADYQPDHDCAWPVSPGMFCGRGNIPQVVVLPAPSSPRVS